MYNGCVESYSAKFVRNHSLTRYSLHCDWLLLSTDLKGYWRLRWSCKPINVPKSLQAVLLALDIMFTLIIWHVSRTNDKVSDRHKIAYYHHSMQISRKNLLTFLQFSEALGCSLKKEWLSPFSTSFGLSPCARIGFPRLSSGDESALFHLPEKFKKRIL